MLIYESEFNELDRVVLSVAHGSVSNPATLDFDWDKYFKLCQRLQNRMTVKSMFDFHSIFTIALRILKNVYLKKVLRNKDFYKECGAGLKVIIVNETGKVFPCEPLWKEVGDLRSNGYDLGKILHSSTMRAFQSSMARDACTCHWGLPITNNLLYKPRFYPRLLAESARIMARSLR